MSSCLFCTCTCPTTPSATRGNVWRLVYMHKVQGIDIMVYIHIWHIICDYLAIPGRRICTEYTAYKQGVITGISPHFRFPRSELHDISIFGLIGINKLTPAPFSQNNIKHQRFHSTGPTVQPAPGHITCIYSAGSPPLPTASIYATHCFVGPDWHCGKLFSRTVTTLHILLPTLLADHLFTDISPSCLWVCW